MTKFQGIRVECYAAYQGEQRPVKFFLGDREHRVLKVADQWYGPTDTYFKVEAEDGHTYILRHHKRVEEDFWTLEAFRRA